MVCGFKTLLGFIEPTIAIGRTTTILNYSTVENVEIKNNKLTEISFLQFR